MAFVVEVVGVETVGVEAVGVETVVVEEGCSLGVCCSEVPCDPGIVGDNVVPISNSTHYWLV